MQSMSEVIIYDANSGKLGKSFTCGRDSDHNAWHGELLKDDKRGVLRHSLAGNRRRRKMTTVRSFFP
jgi:hypothetical protein